MVDHNRYFHQSNQLQHFRHRQFFVSNIRAVAASVPYNEMAPRRALEWLNQLSQRRRSAVPRLPDKYAPKLTDFRKAFLFAFLILEGHSDRLVRQRPLTRFGYSGEIARHWMETTCEVMDDSQTDCGPGR